MTSDMLATTDKVTDPTMAPFLEPTASETREETQRKEREIQKVASILAQEFADECPLQDAFEELELQVPPPPQTEALVEKKPAPAPKLTEVEDDNLADALLLVEDEPLETKPAAGTETATQCAVAPTDQVKTTFDFECITILDPAARADKTPTLVDIELRNVSKEWIAYKIKSTPDFALTLNQPHFCGLLEANSSMVHQLIARSGVRSSEDSRLILETFFLSSLVPKTDSAAPSAQDSPATATADAVESSPHLATDVVDAWEQALPDRLTTTTFRLKVTPRCEENVQEKYVIFCDRFRKEAADNYIQKWQSLETQVQSENCGWLRWFLFFAVFCCGYFTGIVIFARHQLSEGAVGKRKGIDKSAKAK